MKQLFYNGMIVTGKKGEILKNGYLIVNNGKIEKVGLDFEFKDTDEFTEKVHLGGKWVLPGLINTHGHIGSCLLRGNGDDLPLQEWLQSKMWPMEAKFTEKTVKAGASLAIIEMLKSGTTTFLEMYHLHLDIIGQLVEDSGIRSVISRGMIGHCSIEEQEKKLREACDLSKRLRSMAGGRITTMLAPHAPYTCPPEFLKSVIYEAKKKQLPIHIHLSETEQEVNEHIQKYGKRPVVHLAELGMFDVHTLIAHGVHLDDEELKLLAHFGVAVSHNPTSNLKLGSGIADVPSMLNKNILVSIGTDSAASNNNLDMFQEMRMTALIHKGNKQDPTVVNSETALLMATHNGGRALAIDDIGAIETDKDADFIIVDSSSPHLQPSEHLLSHLVYSASGSDVEQVYVKGKCLVRNKECLTMDEEKIIYEANRAFKRLFYS
ncbi:N-ethylammeline chlorohydrolase [Anaerobacillus alkalilacustris]|uniref:5-methylthioadenosine/S-adenosylhomocysteine deaminase n=1 Tax=Anaerobacillus alkalilacustris TaxID=393763 RepID=A0A1S2LRE7_9BACI|nr:amidohydrolase [Anaerobacillus alkalilacustris]OIJ14780.1 N-ethylammeline chlorohydrolase [Anaerobacillus alkalilacustris]